MAPRAAHTRIGTEVAGFRIESVLGRGGMSVVYLAEQVSLSRKVALKLLVHQIVEIDETFRERFLQESHLAAHLDHPNIIPIYDAGEEEDCLYIAMRYVEGPDLERMLEQDGPLGLGRTLFILEQVAGALDAAHEQGLVHRDIKPANILLVEQSDRIYLTDFGVAKPTTSAGLTRTGFFIGTPDYSAPEQIEGRPVGPGTDVYALGAVLYACLTGTPPYARNTEVAVLQAHLLEPPPRLSDARRDLPRALDAVIETAMAKEMGDRYGTCGAMIAAARAASLARPVSLPPGDMPVIVPPDASATESGGAFPRTPDPEQADPNVAAQASATGPADTAALTDEPPPETAPAQEPLSRPPPWRRARLLIGVLLVAVAGLTVALAAVIATRDSGSSGQEATAAGGAVRGTSFSVAMSSSAEVPKSVSSTGSGTAKVTIDGTRVCWDFTLNGVKNPDAAHIHQGGPSESGPVIVPLGTGFARTGCTTATPAAVRQILSDPAGHYVNVHSVTYPDGAVRGQLAKSGTGGATGATEVAGLAGVVPKPIFRDCTVQSRPRAGAAQTAVCVPRAGEATFYPSQLEFSIFRNTKSALAAYAALRKSADVGTDFGRCDGGSWAGEGKWFHAPEATGQPGKPGGRRFCYFDGNVAVIVWTHEKFGQPTHADFLGIARQAGTDHPALFGWWRFWHHRIGKCLQVGCVAKL